MVVFLPISFKDGHEWWDFKFEVICRETVSWGIRSFVQLIDKIIYHYAWQFVAKLIIYYELLSYNFKYTTCFSLTIYVFHESYYWCKVQKESPSVYIRISLWVRNHLIDWNTINYFWSSLRGVRYMLYLFSIISL